MNVTQRRLLRGREFVERLRDAFAERPSTIPLLVLRLPEFAELAWQDGRRAAKRLERTTVRAFAAAADRVMRDGDILGHDDDSDWFAVAMLSPTRGGAEFGAIDARAALERISATMAYETGRRLELGWWPIESTEEIDAFGTTRTAALERGSRERERYEFLATVGHELRTPLTSIRGYIETLLDGDVDAETSRRFLETARREALRLARLVDGMLDFSMLDLHVASAPGATDLGAAIDAALDALLPIARDSGVTLRRCGRADARARIDGDSCMHALLNVVENGIKYSGSGGVVEVSVSHDNPYICVHVDDNGGGVAFDDRDRIFGYGTRAIVQESVRGKGVGLAIALAVVERAGGWIDVMDSHLGGAKFTITLPSLDMRSAEH
ncbi:MAG: HAMP domain-containing histidine kinase [Candidatus Eremiobacteraeota bacterium]|nr:HAMP domain-containing histidine kinase [Candidatus Eremiobacteraeota bacterium]